MGNILKPNKQGQHTRSFSTSTSTNHNNNNNMSEFNIILDTDSYKASHWLQYPPKTTQVFSYIESRGGRHEETVFYGLQYVLKKYLTRPVTMAEVNEADIFFKEHGEPFNKAGWTHVVEKHGGLMQLRVRAVPEGYVIPVSNILVSVENTCPECFWCTSWVETSILRVWYPITVCTESRHIKKIINTYLEKTADDPASELGFKLQDFGSRGVSSQESAAIGGSAHLVNFFGSDTVVGVVLANRYYKAKMAGFSIPAAEHSTITSWGREGEADSYANMLTNFGKKDAVIAVVSDSYDIYNACEKIWGEKLRQQVIDSGAKVVIRPDSGDPPTVVRKCAEILEKKFGVKVNSKGYKVLNYVGIIQGDGINAESIKAIMDTLLEGGFSASIISFGMGGALLQKHHRDTQQFAMKCSHIIANGKGIDVYKQPVTDPHKRSKKGRLDLIRNKSTGKYETIVLPEGTLFSPESVMVTVFENGTVTKEWTFEEVRKNAAI
jgi:nicotinamide phosphoribosyltransferase